jgi:hypothetical protein
MARIASDSAVSRAFAVSDRRSVYHRAKGTAATEPAVSSAAAIDSVFLSADWRRKSAASRRSPLPHIARSATRRSESRSPLGPAAIKGSQPSRRSLLPSRAHFVAGPTANAGLPLAHEPRFQQSLERGDRGALGETSCLLQLVRGRDPAVDQSQDEEVQVGPPAHVTSLRHVAISIRTFGLAIEPGSRSHNILRPADLCFLADTRPASGRTNGHIAPARSRHPSPSLDASRPSVRRES